MKRPSPELKRPTKLMDIQRVAHSAILRPLTDDGDMQPTSVATAESIIKPNDRLTSFERLEIYNRQYWWRLIDIIYDDYPGIRAVLGDKVFNDFTIAYLDRYPSKSFTLRNLGRNIEKFLTDNPKWAGKRQEMAIDMARFEWAQVEAFDGPTKTALTVDDLLGRDPAKLRMSLQPYLQPLALRYPLDDFLLAVKKKNRALRGAASNAIETDRRTTKHKPVPLPKPKRIWLVVHRYDNALYYKRLSQPEFQILSALAAGKTLTAACEAAEFPTSKGEKSIAGSIRKWFTTWTELGWFCLPK